MLVMGIFFHIFNVFRYVCLFDYSFWIGLPMTITMMKMMMGEKEENKTLYIFNEVIISFFFYTVTES